LISRALGFAPMPVPPVAIGIGRRELRYAAFRRTAGRFELRAHHTVPLPDGVFAGGPLGGPVVDAAALETAVGTLLARAGGPPGRISVVLPDAWARGMTVELDELPRQRALADEVLRFRLRKLVPFRVDELRLSAAPVELLSGQQEPLRVLVLLAAEAVCAGVETALAAHGVRVGQITNATLARLGALAAGGGLAGVAALAAVEPEGFVLVFARDGAPVLWRQKSFTEGLDDEDRRRLLAAELRLNRTFLAERLGGDRLDAALLAAPASVAPFWSAVFEQGLGHPVAPLSEAQLPLDSGAAVAAAELAPLLGAAAREVAA
jgi:hypothetical protein